MVCLKKGRPFGGVFLDFSHMAKAVVPGDLETECAHALSISPLLLSVLTQQSSVGFPSHPPCKEKQSSSARALPIFPSQLGEEENASSGGDH